MKITYRTVGGLTIGLCLASSAQAQWVTFSNQTTTRMPVGPGLNTASLSTTDNQEKDYAWGDVDQDGDTDLIVVRKQPFTSVGRRAGVLFMNEGIAEGHSINGVLVDRTLLYASDTDAPAWDDPQIAGGSVPDAGLMTPANNRDVVLVDVNNDTWLDFVTAPTLSDPSPLHIGHPRIYMNQGEVGGVWQGFKYEMARIPQMHTTIHPRFCSVDAVDVTGDGYADLYFGDYDSGGFETFDYNNKFLINQGAANPGFFTDTGTSKIGSAQLLSAFGAATSHGDMNGDGAMDWVKQTSLNPPQHVAVHTNDPANLGTFPSTGYSQISPALAPYFVSVGDLNNDGKLDMVITDDNIDHYHLNQGNGTNNNATFNQVMFPAQTDGFGSQSVIADLNNDGWKDVLIADVDVDITGCGRVADILRNMGNAPNVTFQWSAVISDANLTGTHNFAVFDINNDGWLDLVVGRCSGTQVYMNIPPAGISFSYPEGLPGYITPDQTATIDVQLNPIGSATIAPNTAKVFISLNDGPYVEQLMTSLGGNLYQATLPATACPDKLNYYFSAQVQGGGVIVDPQGAPAFSYTSVAASGTETTLTDEIEGDVSQWSIAGTATAGVWVPVDPVGTINAGAFAAPEDDATGGSQNVKAFVTGNGTVGGGPGEADVDGGTTQLLSPTIDLASGDATISYARWYYREESGGDFFNIEVSNNNGGSWTMVEQITGTTDGINTAWENASFVVSDFVTPTAQVRVRFTASDAAPPSIVEAGIDDFIVSETICDEPKPCPTDVSGDGNTNVDDLLSVINAWGACKGCAADVNGDGNVNVDDLLAVIGGWGACP